MNPPPKPPERTTPPRTKHLTAPATKAPLRLLDATLTEALRGPGKTLDREDIKTLCQALPLSGVPATGPLYPEGAYGWELLLAPARYCIVLEPLTPDAHTHAHRHLQSTAAEPSNGPDGPTGSTGSTGTKGPTSPAPVPLPLPGRAGGVKRVLVDPTSVPLEQADADPEDRPYTLPEGWVRERIVRLPPPPQHPAHGSLPERTGDSRILAKISLLIARMPRHERLRIHDPHGAVTPELAGRLAGLTDAPRLTLHLENPDGLGPATARAALAPARGPLVRTSLLGIGPRTGLPPTELFLPPTRPDGPSQALEQAVGVLQEHGGFRVPLNHPFWGKDRHATVEVEELDRGGAEPRTNPATIPAVLQQHLDEWDLPLTPEEQSRILARLLATVRPGEPLGGPVLWALVAQETDLGKRATGTKRP